MTGCTKAAGMTAVGAAVTVMIVAGFGPVRGEDALSSLVDAERAFARMSVKTSMRDAFMANFADEGVWFAPGPVNTREALGKQPPTPEVAARVLDWDPVTGDVAASGDLGYTTGPWIATQRPSAGEPARQLASGWFFSVWRWNRESGWKVLADFGVDAPHRRTLRAQTFKRAAVRPSAPRSRENQKALADALRTADAEFARRVSAAGWSEALRAAATSDVRAYRAASEPSADLATSSKLLLAGRRSLALQPSFAMGASARDLRFTYGAYTEGTGSASVRGYYLNVWKRQPSGWKLAANIANVQ